MQEKPVTMGTQIIMMVAQALVQLRQDILVLLLFQLVHQSVEMVRSFLLKIVMMVM